MYCRNCGNSLNSNSKFCGKCGSPVDSFSVMNGTVSKIDYDQKALNMGIISIILSFFMFVPALVLSIIGLVYCHRFKKETHRNSKGLVLNIAALIISAVYTLVFIAIFLLFFVVGDKVVESLDNYENDHIYESGDVYETNVSVNDMSITYDEDVWEYSTLSKDDKIIITNSTSQIALTYVRANYYITSLNFAKEAKTRYISQGYEIIHDIEAVEINDLIWQKLVFQKNNYRYTQLFYSNGYDTYSLLLTTDSKYHIVNEVLFKTIYYTLEYDNTNNILDSYDAKEQLIGEWDWGINGYLVIDNDKLYIFKDNSKSMNNVFYGSYTADNKIATNADGYVSGINVILTIENSYLDGEAANLTGKMQYAFTSNDDGTYTIQNVTKGYSGIATKVK